MKSLKQRIDLCIETHSTLLDLTYVELDDAIIAATLPQLVHIDTLNISLCSLERLPDWLAELKGLKSLNASGNKLVSLPDWLAEMKEFQSLNVSGNNLIIVPDWMIELKGLQSLVISRNNLTMLPDWMAELKSLQTLDVGGNNLTTLPDWMAELKNLQTLNVASNNLTTLPDWMAELKNLQTLNVGSNNLTTLPDWMANLKNLQTLNVGSNNLTTLPDWMAELKNLQTLNVGSNNLTTLPDWLSELKSLQSLSADNNKLTILSDCLAELKELTTIVVDNNKLTILPDWLADLQGLRLLNVGNNSLTTLPKSLADLKGLQSLFLGSNNLTSLPEWLVELKGLQNLDISNSNLATVPDWLAELKELQCLFINNNKLSELPDWLGDYQNLMLLLSSNNSLRTIPLQAIASPSLIFIFLDGNSLPEAMLGAAKNGVEALRSYLRQQLTQGVAPLYEARLLIVGEPGAGKTTLMRKLIDPNHQVPNEDDKSTIGINIAEDLSFPWSQNKNQEFRYHIWDFGGQEIQYLTHQFFLTGRSLYVLVSDNRKQDTDFDYWFHIVSLLGEASPMLVVCNAHPNNPVSRFDECYYRELFPELKTEKIDVDFAKNDSKQGFLRQRIFETLSILPHVGEDLPAGWPKVREALRKLSAGSPPRNYLPFTEFADICRENQILTDDDQRVLSGYLHDLGAVLHFQKDPTLKDTLFLSPKWVTEGVYRVLKDDGLDDVALGRFTRARLFGLWQEEGYSHTECEMLLGLMGQFKLDICYPLRESHNDEYVVPIRLPLHRPHFDFDDKDCLEFQYHYEFQPRGLISRLLVYLHDQLAKENREELVWQQGFVVERNGNRALIQDQRSRDGRKYLGIQVDGVKESRREMLAIVRREIEKLHRNRIYKQVKVTEMIPCCGPVCSVQAERNFFTLTELSNYLKNDWSGIRCTRCKEEIIIADLLGNVTSIGREPLFQKFIKGSFSQQMIDPAHISPSGEGKVWRSYGNNIIQSLVNQAFNPIENYSLHSNLDILLAFADRIRPVVNVSTQNSATATSNPDINIDIKVDIDIKNTAINHFAEAIDLLREDIEQVDADDAEKIFMEIERGKQYLEAARKAENPEVYKESPSAGRLTKFVEKLADGTSTLGKAVQLVDDGIESVQKIAGYYNKIAQWCGLPNVPAVFTK